MQFADLSGDSSDGGGTLFLKFPANNAILLVSDGSACAFLGDDLHEIYLRYKVNGRSIKDVNFIGFSNKERFYLFSGRGHREAKVEKGQNLSAEEEVYNWLLIGKKTGVLESAGEKRH
jgi:hypothetical protein